MARTSSSRKAGVADAHSADSAAVLTKSELIARIAVEQPQLLANDVELAVKILLRRMASGLVRGERVEIRGFGSLSLRYRAPRMARNPKTGEKVAVAEKYAPHFRPGVELRKRVDGKKGARAKSAAVVAAAEAV